MTAKHTGVTNHKSSASLKSCRCLMMYQVSTARRDRTHTYRINYVLKASYLVSFDTPCDLCDIDT